MQCMVVMVEVCKIVVLTRVVMVVVLANAV